MFHKIIKITFATGFLCFLSFASSASIVKDEFIFDSTTSIISDGKYEWLAWSETAGMSISQAEAAYGVDGWSVMLGSDLDYLYNAWFNVDIFNILNGEAFSYVAADLPNGPEFYQMFGCTLCNFILSDTANLLYRNQNPINISDAWVLLDNGFGSYTSVNNSFSYEVMFASSPQLGWIEQSTFGGAFADFQSPNNINETNVSRGVGLVRKVAVPEPSTLAIFVLCIVCFSVRGFNNKIKGV